MSKPQRCTENSKNRGCKEISIDITDKMRCRINGTEVRFLRKIENKTRMDRIR